MNTNRRAVVVTLVAILALGVGSGGSVAADSVGPLDNDTNTTDTLSTTTNETLDGVENTTNDTVEVLDDTSGTLNETTDTVESTAEDSTETLQNTTDTLESSVEESSESLTDDETLSEMLLTDPDDPEGTTTLDGDTPTATPREPNETNGTATATGTEAPVGDAGTGSGLSGVGSNLPGGPATGAAAVGVGAVLVGAVVRQLGGMPAPVQGLAAARRGTLGRLSRLFAPLRYSRYDDSDPLEHEDRATVFEAVEDSPGVYLTELSEQTGVSLSTLRHHARVLEREDLIVAARVRGRRRFYPAYTEDVELAAAMNDEATAPVVDALARLGAASVSELADAVDRDTSTLTYHLQRLEADGLVVREREGRAIVNRLAPEAREALAPLRETDADPAEAEATASAD